MGRKSPLLQQTTPSRSGRFPEQLPPGFYSPHNVLLPWNWMEHPHCSEDARKYDNIASSFPYGAVNDRACRSLRIIESRNPCGYWREVEAVEAAIFEGNVLSIWQAIVDYEAHLLVIYDSPPVSNDNALGTMRPEEKRRCQPMTSPPVPTSPTPVIKKPGPITPLWRSACPLDSQAR